MSCGDIRTRRLAASVRGSRTCRLPPADERGVEPGGPAVRLVDDRRPGRGKVAAALGLLRRLGERVPGGAQGGVRLSGDPFECDAIEHDGRDPVRGRPVEEVAQLVALLWPEMQRGGGGGLPPPGGPIVARAPRVPVGRGRLAVAREGAAVELHVATTPVQSVMLASTPDVSGWTLRRTVSPSMRLKIRAGPLPG